MRSWLFVPGHRPAVVAKALAQPADAIIVDLEDAVPAEAKAAARETARAVCVDHAVWVRINPARTAEAHADLDSIAEFAHGVRVPKVEDPDDVSWISERVDGQPLICAIETARGVQASAEIAAHPACRYLALGGVDLRRDLGCGSGSTPMLFARSQLVVAARAADIEPPIDSVFTLLHDTDGLVAEAKHAHSLGFGGKSAIHPRQVDAINTVFAVPEHEATWAQGVVNGHHVHGGEPFRLESGEFVDLPVVLRARAILDRRDRESAQRTGTSDDHRR